MFGAVNDCCMSIRIQRPLNPPVDRQNSLREFSGTECSTVIHGAAIYATDVPEWYSKNSYLQSNGGFHNAGVGGSSPPVATILSMAYAKFGLSESSLHCT